MATENKGSNHGVKHHWNSYNSLIADTLRQNDLKEYERENPHLRVVDPEHLNGNAVEKNIQNMPKRKKREHRKRAFTVSSAQYAEKQSMVDENEEDIYAAMSKKGGAMRRDSNIKKTIIKSFQELESQNKETSKTSAARSTVNTYDLL